MSTAPAGRPDPRRREPLWSRVDRNRIQLAAYVALFVASSVLTAAVMFILFGGCALIFIFMGSEVGTTGGQTSGSFRELTIMASLLAGSAAFAWALFAVSRSERWLVKRLGAQLAPTGDLIAEKMALKDMALAAGMPVAPAFYVLENSAVNAFVFSARGRRPIVGVTRGMIAKLDIDEQRAVFANLIARIASGDTIVDTGVAALMMPLNAWRERNFIQQNKEMDRALLNRGRPDESAELDIDGVGAVLFYGIAMAIVGAVFASAQRNRQRRGAEKADAEGMLLLKDPAPMLSALEKCVVWDNRVPAAGEALADLFYCWPASSTNDEDDPEWKRVARLREVLGVEGMVDERECALPDGALAPHAPRIQ